MECISENELRELYLQALRLHISPQDLPNEGLLASLQIDSVSIMEIAIRIEIKYGVELDLGGNLSPAIFDSFADLVHYLSSECRFPQAGSWR